MTNANSRVTEVSIVIPVYNSAQILPTLIAEIETFLETGTPRGELILIDDGSGDDSWEVIERLAAERAWIRGIRLMRNFGQHNALLCGIRAARHGVVVTLDDDLQHRPSEISKLLLRLEQGYDVVYGPAEKLQHGLWRDLASRVTKIALQRAMGVEAARSVCAFRAFRTNVREGFSGFQGSFVSIDVLLTWGTTRFSVVPTRHDRRQSGVSQYTFRKLLAHTMNMMTGFSTIPLQLASWIGFGMTFFGVVLLAWVVGRYFVAGDPVPGFPFLASMIAVFSGAQLFALGVMGEYLARIFHRSMDRPAYSIRQTLRDTSESLP